MPELWGQNYSIEELRTQTGSLAQVAGIRISELSEGRARGIRVAEVYTGSGFRFQVLLDRALDIGAAEFQGKPLAWVHPALGGPELFEPAAAGWGRTFGGGLMTTCGLTFFGAPENDNGEELGLHGRISHQRGEQVWIKQEWVGERYQLQIGGMVRQAVLFGENLILNRTITTWMGANHLVIEDTVRNEGFRSTPHMLLYHCNFGFPVVSSNSQLLIDEASVRGRDDAANAGLGAQKQFDKPDANYPEQVFFYAPNVGEDGFVRAAIVNDAIGFGGFLRYRAAELPCFAQWKMMGAGDYVCGLEPATNWETPRSTLREQGLLRHLEAGEEVHYRVELGALPTPYDMDSFRRAI
ncbi:aldose 1-epimerase family protein [soil metagenome]